MLECSVDKESNKNLACQTWVSTMGVDTSETNLWTTCRIRQVVNNKYLIRYAKHLWKLYTKAI